MKASLPCKIGKSMNDSQALNYTHSLKRLGSTPGLACLQAVMEKLGNPQEKLSCIHVAGTNGKGSVCAVTASILRQAGDKVGLYTSPFLVDFLHYILQEHSHIDRYIIYTIAVFHPIFVFLLGEITLSIDSIKFRCFYFHKM